MSTEKNVAHDPVAVVKAFDAACNAGDIERAMAFFAGDAVVRVPVEPGVHTGKQQIRAWLQPQMRHFRVAPRNQRVTGNTVTWEITVTGDLVRQAGSTAIKETAKAIVRGGKITSFALTIVGRKPCASPPGPVRIPGIPLPDKHIRGG
jgi:ketosteroid isomerase-like protein